MSGLVACHQESETKHSAQYRTAEPSFLPNQQKVSLSPNHSLMLGRSSAILGFLARQWQITHINNIPISQTAIFDLTNIHHGQATLSLGRNCTPIYLTLDIKNINKGEIYTKEIERTLDDCSNTLEDHLMSALADISYLEGNNDNGKDYLTFNSYQDKIMLIPKTP